MMPTKPHSPSLLHIYGLPSPKSWLHFNLHSRLPIWHLQSWGTRTRPCYTVWWMWLLVPHLMCPNKLYHIWTIKTQCPKVLLLLWAG